MEWFYEMKRWGRVYICFLLPAVIAGILFAFRQWIAAGVFLGIMVFILLPLFIDAEEELSKRRHEQIVDHLRSAAAAPPTKPNAPERAEPPVTPQAEESPAAQAPAAQLSSLWAENPAPPSPSNTSYFNTVTVIDLETATDSLTSICAIGLCFIREGQIIRSDCYYVQPPENRYNAANISIHGITPDITKNADSFPVVWEKIKHCFQNTYIAAHNAKRFDMPALKAAFEQFGIDQPQFEFIDTMYICDEFKDPKCQRSLDALCSSFSIQLDHHHDAKADAIAAAELILYSFEHSKFRAFNVWLKHHVEMLSFCDVSPRYTFSTTTKHPKIDVHEIAVTTEVNDEKDDDFNGKTFLFTGTLQHFSREEAMRKVVERGGIIKNGISNKVDVLVNANPDGVTTSKVEKAIAMQAAGHRIKIINEEQFLKMLESNNAIQI